MAPNKKSNQAAGVQKLVQLAPTLVSLPTRGISLQSAANPETSDTRTSASPHQFP
jgi:hypothetical protein